MKKDPRMSPLFAPGWEKMSERDQDTLIDKLHRPQPPPPFKPGDTFEVMDNGKFLLLEPNDKIKPRRVPAPVQ